MTGPFKFRPHDKLRSSHEFQKVKQSGRRLRTRHFGVNFSINGLPYHRLGLVVQKRFWSAVLRNRIKRVLREWFRGHRHRVPLPGRDIVIIARPGAERLSAGEAAAELHALFVKQDGR